MTIRGSMPGVLMPRGKPYKQKKGKKSAKKGSKEVKGEKGPPFGPRKVNV